MARTGQGVSLTGAVSDRIFPRVVGPLCTIALLFLGCQQRNADAQPPQDARIVLMTGGPTAAVRTLEFSADSRRLYAAGADKAVEIWSLNDARGHAPDLKLVDHARWPIARGDRGQIWTLAVNDARKLIAFGGYGAQQINGDISIADSIHGRQLTILPSVLANEDPRGRFESGHLNTVTSVSFSPDGEWLASISLDGEIRLWSVANWTSVRALPAGENPGLTDVFVQFVSNTEFLASLNPLNDKGESASQLRRFVIGSDQKITMEPVQSPHSTIITAIAFDSKSGRTFTGDAIGGTVVWEGKTPSALKKPFRTMPVRKFSASQNGLLLTLFSPTRAAIAAGTREPVYVELEQFTDRGTVLVERREWNLMGESLAAALSPDGTCAAIARPGEAAIEVFGLVDAKQRPITKPFTARRPTILAGSGTTVQQVEFLKEPASLLKISSVERSLGFDLSLAEVVRPANLANALPAHPSPDWSVDVSPSLEGQDQTLTIKSRQTDRGQIVLSHTKHGHYAAHCWIFEKDKTEPSGIAIGTLRQNGIFVFDLREPGQASLLRYYRDHTNAVVSLSQSADGRYLASSSLDQAIRLWSLDGLLADGGADDRSPAWGGKFAVQNAQLVVQSLLEFSILKSRKLNDGDRILKIAYSANGQRVEVVDADQMLTVLKSLPLTESVEVHAQRAGRNLPPFIVTPAWEPLATLFIDRRNEWAVWTAGGYYNASVDGDELFGFQINPARRGDEPRFSRAEQLREQYERPDLLKNLFTLGSFDGAAKAVALVPQNPGALVAKMPRIRINSPEPGVTKALGETFTISADVDYGGLPLNEFRVDAWLNGAKLSSPVSTVEGTTTRYNWTVAPPAGEHQFLMKVVSVGPTMERGLYSDVTLPFSINGEPAIRTVHVLAIGANNYQGSMKLSCCIADAQDFKKLIMESAGPHYRMGLVKVIVDENPGAAALFEKGKFQEQVTQFAREIKKTGLKSNDIVIVYIAGLGEVVGKEYYFVPPVSEIKNLSQQAVVQRYSIPWTAFREFVEEIPNCAKIFFLDTCHAGNIARLESDKARLRPLKNLNTVVFAATSDDQFAREDQDGQHGHFTGFLLEGLGGSADGSNVIPALAGLPAPEPDGKVSLLETVGYVSTQVLQRWKTQQPRYTPVTLIRFLNDPIVDVARPENPKAKQEPAQ